MLDTKTPTEGLSLSEGGPRLVSNSEIQAFLECPQKWRLRYVDGFQEPKTATGHLSLGTLVHSALQAYGEGDYDVAAGLQVVDDSLVERLEEFPDAEGDIRKEHELARLMVEGYFQHIEEEAWEADYETVGLEKTYSMPLEVPGHGTVMVVGKVDRLRRDRSSGLLVVEDYKTTASFDDVRKIADITWQFRLYPELVQAELGEPTDGTLVTMLRKVKRSASAKPPFYDRERLRWRQSEREAFGYQLLGTVTRLLDTHKALLAMDDCAPGAKGFYAPAVSSRDCTWKCPFYKVCPQVQAGFDISHLYEVVPPYTRYTEETD